MGKTKNLWILVMWYCICVPMHITMVSAEDIIPAPQGDPHYTEVGFFDIHVCNWPDRPLFFLALFSSYEYNKLLKVEVFTPQGENIGELDLNKYRIIEQKGKPLKKAFIKHFDIPGGSGDGWYYALVTLKDGKIYRGEDFVVLREMRRARNMTPVAGAEDISLPKVLKWDAIPGAKHYQVFIKDLWEGKLLHTSKLLSKPYFDVPKELLKPGGYYSWRVHARDVNENVILGDFNHGSLTNPIEFSVATE